MSDLNLSLVLRLVDQATGPARAVISGIQGAAAAVSEAGENVVASADEQIAAAQASRAAMHSQALQTLAAGGALALLTKPAIDMEQSMAGVRKVIDFKDQTVFGALQNDILGLISSKGIPMTAEGIASIIESAGQAGIVAADLADDEKRRQLIAYAEAAAKMGVAFDVSAETAGAAMTMWRSRLKMTHADALVMGDAVNHLSNNMDATADAILNVINRQGAVAMSSGLARENIAALSAAFVASAPSPEIAATGMKNFLSVMTTGEGLTDGRKSILTKLGFDAEELAKRMQVDAKGAIIEVMEALKELPEHAQAAALTKLFGEESKSTITPLLTNLDMLRGAFEMVGDPAEFAGSMLKEYESQASTTAAGLVKLTGFFKALSVTIGATVLPEINALLNQAYPVLDLIRDWAVAHPELIGNAIKLAAGLQVLRLATVAARYAFVTLKLPILYATRAIGGMLMYAPRLAMGLLGLLNPMNLVRYAAIAMRSALLLSGAGAVIAGIALGGAWIYNNWAGLKEFFIGFGAGFMAALGPAAPMINKVIEAGQQLWAWVLKITGPLNLSAEAWRELGVEAGEAIGGIVAKVSEWTGANPGLLTGLVGLTVGLAALRTVLLLPARMVFGTFRAIMWGARMGLLPLRLLTRGVRAVGRGFAALNALRALPWARIIPRPNFAAALAGFRSFGRSAAAHVANLANAVGRNSVLMSQSLGRVVGLLLKLGLVTTAFAIGLGIKPTGDGTLSDETRDWWNSPEGQAQRKDPNHWSYFGNSPAAAHQNPGFYGGLPDKQSAAAQAILAAQKGGLPNEALKEAAAYKEELLSEIAKLEAKLASIGNEPGAIFAKANTADELTALRAELAEVEAELAEAATETQGLQQALALLGVNTVALSIDQSDLDAALAKARQLVAALNATKDGKAPPPVGDGPVQERAVGGAYRPGWLLTGERGPEMRFMSQGGYIANHHALRSAMQMSDRVRRNAALAGQALSISARQPRIDMRPALRSSGTGGGAVTVNATVNITAAPGQDAQAIAREVTRQLRKMSRPTRGAELHDGGEFDVA